MERKGRLGFVPARYGDGVVGGAEAVLREMAHGLAQRGWDVEILTTCARDHFTWVNEFAPGTEEVADGVVLRRFPTVISTPRAERAQLGAAIHAGVDLRLAEQERWINDDVRVPELFHYLLDEAERYRALVFAPYLFWPAFACGQVAPDRTILMPCLHDEPEAQLEIFRPIFSGSRRLWFLSDPERDLAERIFPRLAPHEVIGSGLAVPEQYDVAGFRERHGISGRFVLFAGRREGGKNWERMLDAFAHAVVRENLPFSLVTMGHGEIDPPAVIADRVIDLGFLPDAERDAAFAAADAYIQPSANESFSRTIMEAWLAGTIVIATGESAVNRWHCDRSGAGLVYDNDGEFAQALRFVAEAPEAAASIAAGGRDYVLEHYTWPPILDTVEASIDAWMPPMRILMVSPYPPTRDGLANYAVQEVKLLRAEGHDVEVLSPGPSAAHHHLELKGPRGGLALAKRVRGYDRVIVQFHPAMFFPEPSTSPERAAIYGALALAWRSAADVELRVHEFPHEGAAGSRIEAHAARAMWLAVDHISVHTEVERQLLAAAYGLATDRITVVDPGASFERRTELTQEEARARLGLAPDGFIFLSIGFLQPHKGFDRAVRAFGDLGERGCRLEIVGSLRVDAPEYLMYLEDLRELVDETNGATLHEEYVSDAEFDVWIVAADALVLPYRLIWSSSVCERASLYQRPLIASRVGGLEDQTPSDAIMVDSDRDLADAMQRVAGLEPVATPAGPWPGADRDAVMREIRSRAGAHHSAFRSVRNEPASSATLRRLPPLRIPGPRSVRPGVSTVKWVVRLLTAWELDPVVNHVNRLQQTVTDALAGPTGRADRADEPRTPPTL